MPRKPSKLKLVPTPTSAVLSSPIKKNPGGQPEKILNLVEVEKLATLHCTDEDLADWFGVSTKTIQRRKEVPEFREALERGRARFRISLRQAQHAAIQKGVPAVLIFCGKNYLGQRDRFPDEVEAVEQITRLEVEWIAPKPESDEPDFPKLPADKQTKSAVIVQ